VFNNRLLVLFVPILPPPPAAAFPQPSPSLLALQTPHAVPSDRAERAPPPPPPPHQARPWRRWTANPTSRCRRAATRWRCPTPARRTRARTAAPTTTAPTRRARPSPTTPTSCASPSGRTGRGRATTANSHSQVPRFGLHQFWTCIPCKKNITKLYIYLYIQLTNIILPLISRGGSKKAPTI